MNLSITEGLLQLSSTELDRLNLTHLLSGLDDEDLEQMACGSTTLLSGYTEWVSPDASTLTLGWDWELSSGVGRPCVKRLGMPRTNIQVLDSGRNPLAWDDNLRVLADFIDRIDWASCTFDAICERHAN